jgi:hypothetical protein
MKDCGWCFRYDTQPGVQADVAEKPATRLNLSVGRHGWLLFLEYHFSITLCVQSLLLP